MDFDLALEKFNAARAAFRAYKLTDDGLAAAREEFIAAGGERAVALLAEVGE